MQLEQFNAPSRSAEDKPNALHDEFMKIQFKGSQQAQLEPVQQLMIPIPPPDLKSPVFQEAKHARDDFEKEKNKGAAMKKFEGRFTTALEHADKATEKVANDSIEAFKKIDKGEEQKAYAAKSTAIDELNTAGSKVPAEEQPKLRHQVDAYLANKNPAQKAAMLKVIASEYPDVAKASEDMGKALTNPIIQRENKIFADVEAAARNQFYARKLFSGALNEAGRKDDADGMDKKAGEYGAVLRNIMKAKESLTPEAKPKAEEQEAENFR